MIGGLGVIGVSRYHRQAVESVQLGVIERTCSTFPTDAHLSCAADSFGKIDSAGKLMIAGIILGIVTIVAGLLWPSKAD